MKDDNQRGLKPKLRFPEFREEPSWTAEPLGKSATLITEKAGERKCVFLSITSGVGLISQEEKFGRTIAGNSYKNYLLIERNDFAYNKSATKEFPQGFIAMYSGNEPGSVPNSIFTCFRVQEDRLNVYYLNYLFFSNLHGRWLTKYITVGARAHGSLSIGDEYLLSLPIPRPSGESSLGEQQKIADCLSSLDELIAAHIRKLDALKIHKKWLMQQLFPREGEIQPPLRFPEFQDAGEWKETSLGQIVTFESGGTPSKQDPGFWNGSIPWVSAKDMKQLFLEDTEDHITTSAVDDGAKQVPTGTVLMLTRGMTLFKDVPICVLRRPMSFNQDVKALRANGDLHAEFLPFLLLANKQRMLRMVDLAGHGTGRLNTDELKSLNVTYPQGAEQLRIAECLSSLELLIPAQIRKLGALKTHKKGLMQQLFPSPDEVEP